MPIAALSPDQGKVEEGVRGILEVRDMGSSSSAKEK